MKEIERIPLIWKVKIGTRVYPVASHLKDGKPTLDFNDADTILRSQEEADKYILALHRSDEI
jgi:hypothetical protein